MKLTELHKNVKLTLDRFLNISETLSIQGIPKQKFFDKGDLVILLDENKESVSMEWFKNGHYHIELKGKLSTDFLSEAIKISEESNNDIISYKVLSPILKNMLKFELKLLEDIIEKRYSKFNNKLDKNVWLKSVQLHNGSFTEWCVTHNYGQVTDEAITEACIIAENTNDHLLKKRAMFSKCFLKLATFK